MRVPLTIALTVLPFIPSLALAQFPDRVQSGARVRVWVPDAYPQDQGPWRRQQLRGTVAELSGDTLRLSVPGTDGTLAVPRASIRRLDVSKGKPSRAATAFERAVTFALVGAVTFGIDHELTGPNDSGVDWREARLGAAWGAGIGAVVGFVWPTERWRRVRLPRPPAS
jgi:hypothetical protein